MVTINNLGNGSFYFDFGKKGVKILTITKATALAFTLFGNGKLLLSELEKLD